MARAKLSALLVSLQGRYAGGVFRNWKGLTVLGALPVTVRNPNTSAQVSARDVVSVVSKGWSGLTAEARAQWAAVGDYLTTEWGNYVHEVGTDQIIKVPRGPFGLMQALVAIHGLLQSIGEWNPQLPLVDAPVGVTGPSAPRALSLAGDTDGLVVTVTAPADWGTNGTTGEIRVWLKSEDGLFFAQMATSGAAGPFTITTARASGTGHPVPLKEGWYFVQCDAVNAEGLRGTPGAVAKINLAAHV